MRVLDLLGREVRGGILREQPREDEQAIERSTQLMGDVRKELRLVPGGQVKLLGTFLDLPPGLLDLDILDLDIAVLAGQLIGLVLQVLIGTLQLLLPCLQFPGAGLQLSGQPLRLREQRVGPRVRDDGVDVDADRLHQLLKEVLVHLREPVERAGLDHAEDPVLEDDRQHDQVDRRGLAKPGGDLHIVGRGLRHDDGLPGLRHLADQRLAEPELAGRADIGPQAVPCDQAQPGIIAGRVSEEERAVLRPDQGDELVHDELGDGRKIAVALHQPGDAGETGLQPLLLMVGLRGLPQRLDHRVDVVLELGDLALGLYRNGPGEVAGGHGAGHRGDCPHLAGQVAGQLVDVLRQPLPGAGHALDLGLAAKPSLAADLPRDAGDLGGEGRQLVDHRVDGGLQLQDLPARVDVDPLRQVALGDGSGDLCDVAHLAGQVGRHRVDVVGQVLPGPGDVGNCRPAAENALGADVPGDPRHLVGER